MKIRKKFLGLLLTLALIAGVTPTAFAGELSGKDAAQNNETTTDQAQ